MGSRLTSHLAGIAIPMDADRLLDDLAVNDGSATGSSYTQAGPRPGVSVPESARSRLVPVVSGGLGQDIEIVTLRGGTPALSADASCELGYRLADGTDLSTRGWTAPNWVTGCWPVRCTATTDTEGALATLPGSQQVVAVLAYASKVYVRTYDPDTDTWGSVVEVHDGAVSSCSVLVLPSGRILVTADDTVYRSDDDGATWTLHAERPYAGFSDPLAGVSRVRLAYAQGQICAVGADGTGLTQWASSDDLGSLELVKDDASGGRNGCVVALPGGGFVIAYRSTAASTLGYPCVRVLASAYQPYDEAEEVVVAAETGGTMALTADPDGLLWLHTAGDEEGTILVYVSADGGPTWSKMTSSATDLSPTGVSSDYLDNLSSTHAAGATYLMGEEVIGGTVGSSNGVVVRLGGWETVTTRSGPTDARLIQRLGSGAERNGSTYLGFVLPGDTGKWTRTAAGSPTESLDNRGVYLATVAGADQVYFTHTISTELFHTVEAGVRVIAGGSSTADEIFLNVRVADATNDYKLRARLYVSGGTVWIITRDPNAGAPTKDTEDTGIAAGSLMRLRLHIENGTGYVWYANGYSPVWTLAWFGALTSDTATPAANGHVQWAHFEVPASVLAESSWAYVAAGGDAAGTVGSGLAASSSYGVAGRPLSLLPIPLHPELADGDGMVPWLAVAAGPGTLGEVIAVDRDYDYPIEHILPTVSPSPAERWRSTSTSAQTIAWDAGDETWIGDSVALVVAGANFRTADLDYYNGAAWVTVGSLDLATGFAGLDYSLSGEALIPGNSTTSGGRYLQEGELAGGYVVLETGGGAGTAAFKVRWNTAGSWVSSGTGTPRTRILLDGDLSSVDATGQCDIVWPAGVLVVHAAAILRARRWRVVIDGSQVVPDAYYTAGCLVPMAVRAFGAAPDWGWSREREPNAETRTSRRGTSRVRKLGPPIDVWSMAWTSGTDLYDLRNTASPSYVGSSVGLPLTAAEDVGWLLGGLLTLAESGAVPVVSLAEIPDASGTTLTDPSLWMLGRLSSGVRIEHVVGDEGSAEVVRVSQIDVRKLA